MSDQTKTNLSRRALLAGAAGAAIPGLLPNIASGQAGGTVKLTAWSAAVDQVKSHATAFEKGTGIKVAYENFPWAQYRTSVVTRLVGNADMDVLWVSDAWLPEFAEAGWLGIAMPEQYGGAGLGTTEAALLMQTIAASGAAMSGASSIHMNIFGLNPVVVFGSDEQKQRWLPPLIAGKEKACFAVTEPNAGLDTTHLQTKAVRDGDHYVVNGAKTWITNSLHGGCLALLVKTDPQAEPRHKGMSLFIAEKGPGFIVTRKLKKLGYRGIDTCELQFDNYRVPADRLIGGVEGRGLQQVLSGLELGRINVAARGLGVATASLHDAVAYAQQRKTFGKPICEHQAIQLKLGEMGTKVEAARLLVEAAARAYDRGERCDMEAGMAKYFATEAAMDNALECMRIHGAYGYSPEFDVERYYRDAPLLLIGEGTNEMQRMIIARQLIQRHPA